MIYLFNSSKSKQKYSFCKRKRKKLLIIIYKLYKYQKINMDKSVSLLSNASLILLPHTKNVECKMKLI